MDLIQSHFMSRKINCAFFEVALVSMELLPMFNQVSPSMWMSQNVSRREKLQTYHTSWALIDWLTKWLILRNSFFDPGQESYWHLNCSKNEKTIFEWYFDSKN